MEQFQFTFSAIYDGLQFWWTSLDGVRGGWTSEGYYRRISLLSRYTNNSMHAYLFLDFIFIFADELHFIWKRKVKKQMSKWNDKKDIDEKKSYDEK